MRIPPRGIVPPGRLGLLLIAAAMVPVVLARCKPFAKKVGEALVKAGEKLKETAEEPTKPVATASATNDERRATKPPVRKSKPRTKAKPTAKKKASPKQG
ncbi:MAG: hypothetical protein HYR64_09515 [Fimbriimonas ginsengisoli]|uniref:Uncharacterized protein n=1 Tax=Fimbriimonas ginsengisoli TaxID=1005039 RepID=A0A931LW54_FIMGI|nr:hypothetical protein [Fimbriimonas ginsengisoli]